jgi:hypothetical protein
MLRLLPRRTILRMLVLLVVGHIAGSLGLELLKIVSGKGTTLGDILRSPVRDLRYTIKLTWDGLPYLSGIGDYANLLFERSFYVAPFAAAVVIVLVMHRRSVLRRDAQRGFDVVQHGNRSP